MMDEQIKEILPGAVRFEKDGVMHVVNPKEYLYSTALMFAVEYFADGEWHPALDNDD